MDTKLIVSGSPHLRSEETTTGLMANVIVALTRASWPLPLSLVCVLCWSPQCPSWPAWLSSGCTASC